MFYDLTLRLATAMASAPEGAPNQEGHTIIMLAFYAGLFAIFYFLLIRPQTKRSKEVKEMQESLKKGDVVLTTSGFYATIHKIKDETVWLEIADGVRLKAQRSAIAEKAAQQQDVGKKDDE